MGATVWAQTTRYVVPVNPGALPPYTSWATAATNIQDAVDVAVAGDTVRVTNGVYFGTARTNANDEAADVFIERAISLESVNGPTVTIIDAGYPAKSNACLWVTNGAVVAGFTLRNAAGSFGGAVIFADGGTVQGCTLVSNRVSGSGGAIYGTGGRVLDSTIGYNRANYGGGAYVYDTCFSNCLFEGNFANNTAGGAYIQSGSQVENCRFVDNVANGSQGAGGIYAYGFSLVRDSLFLGNTATNYNGEGGGVLLWNSKVEGCEITGNYGSYGAGVCLNTTNDVVTNCLIRLNHAQASGGGVYFDRAGTMVNSIIRENAANLYGGGANLHYGGHVVDCFISGNRGARGGGVQCYYTGTVERCVITENLANNSGNGGGGLYTYYGGGASNSIICNNTASGRGGGVYFRSGGWLENCTVSGNRGDVEAGGIYGYSSGGWLQNTIVYHNYTEYAGTLSFTNCCTPTLPPSGENNITGDPLFVNRAAGDFHLATNSPCVNAGTNQDWMMGAVDLDFASRLVGGTVDIGAYELGDLRGNFTAAPEFGLCPLAVQFHGWLVGLNTEASYYGWDFENDGIMDVQGADSGAVEHVYSQPGVYTVSLVVSNRAGQSALCVRSDCVAVLETNRVHVAPGGGNAYPYDTWANAAHLLHDAIAACPAGGAVLVSNGTYCPCTYVLVTNGIQVVGVNGPSVTRVDGQAIRRGFWLDHSNALISGFTITNMYANLSPGGQHGAGVYVNSGGTVSNCVIAGCRGSRGTGFYIAMDGLIVDSVVVGNQGASHGGGGYCENGGVVLRSTLRDNFSGYLGGGLYMENAGVIRDSFVVGNTASNNTSGWGGGIYCNLGGAAERCVIVSNRAAGDGRAGGIRSYRGVPPRNCLIAYNTARYGGGTWQTRAENCTIFGNTATVSGGGSKEGTNWNCIVYGNTSADGSNNYAQTVFAFSCTTPDPGGTGNIMDDPLFVASGGGNFRLATNSPCIEAGSNYTWVASAMDLDGKPRLLGTNVDMGAYEDIPRWLDTDHDGMPDWWEWDYSHCITGMIADADIDIDYMSNLAEWWCGTIPNNDASYLGAMAATCAGDGPVIHWQSVNGKLYTLARSTNLAAGAWVPVQSGIPGLAPMNTATDTTAAGSGPWHYRVELE